MSFLNDNFNTKFEIYEPLIKLRLQGHVLHGVLLSPPVFLDSMHQPACMVTTRELAPLLKGEGPAEPVEDSTRSWQRYLSGGIGPNLQIKWDWTAS